MQENSDSAHPKIRWRFWQLILMLTPGIAFAVTHPRNYRHQWEKALSDLRSHPRNNWTPEYCASLAGMMSGMLMLAMMFFCAAIVSMDQPVKKQSWKKFSWLLAL